MNIHRVALARLTKYFAGNNARTNAIFYYTVQIKKNRSQGIFVNICVYLSDGMKHSLV